MKLPLLILLLHLGSCATLEPSKGEGKDLFGKATLGQTLSNVTEGSKKNRTMDIATIVKIWQRFRRLKDKIMKQLALTPEQQEAFAAKLKKWKVPEEEKVKAAGHSIGEINKKIGIGKMLFQGDVMLTKAQADQIVDDIEKNGSDRSKRQAFRDRNYPWTIWSGGVYYYFDASANEKARSAFSKAVQAWRKDTCIDFYYSAEAPSRIRLLKGDGCWSQMGRLGGEQDLSLGNDCETAPPGAVIEVKIESFTPGLFSFGCKFAGVEIKTQKDQRLTGFRFCAHTDAGRTLVSETNRVPIITYNRYGESTTVLKYRTLKNVNANQSSSEKMLSHFTISVGAFITNPQPVSTPQPYYSTTTTTPMPTSCMDKPT
ncbi:astacin [Ostertagia ostertagi]